MRLPRESLLFICLASAFSILACLLFGLITGQGFDTSAPRATPTTGPATVTSQPLAEASPATPAAADASPSPMGPQRSLIIIGVDDAQAAIPKLEGVWI